MRLSREDVIKYIREFLEGSGEQWDWDDFTSVPLDDPTLERVRLECVSLPDRFPPKRKGHYCSEAGLEELRRLAETLESL
mgnify:CR=1 FL=1